MYAPNRGIVPYKFEVFKEMGNKRRPLERLRGGLFSLK